MTIRPSWRLACSVTALTVVACSPGKERTTTDTTAAGGGQTTASGDVATPHTMAGPNPQMAAVLDTLQGLGGKPIETLSAPEARKQPTPADAAKNVLAAEGKPTAPDPAVKSVDRTIPGPGGCGLVFETTV